MVRLKLSYCYNYIKLVNGKAKIKLLLQLQSNIELMIEHDLRLDMCFPYTPRKIELPSARPILLRSNSVRCLDNGFVNRSAIWS